MIMSTQEHVRPWLLLPPLVILSLSFLVLASPSQLDELDTLLKLKASLTSPNTDVFNSWTRESSSPCNFTGISCDFPDGHVTGINLSGLQLEGILPFGSICGELSSLEVISMGNNSLHGAISSELKNCTGLQVLDLGWNSFSGEVPDLSSLKSLKLLSLNKSGVSGSFPWKSLENLTGLAFLSLGDNPFDVSGSFPDEVVRLGNLSWVYLSNCSIRGQIPEGIGNLTQLENLELADNLLFGGIPAGIGKLSNLWQLELYNNSLTGTLPVGFGNLTSLVNFDASRNKLEGGLAELKHLSRLASVQLYENQLTGEIPEEFGEFRYLEELSLYRNKLTGTLPQKIGSWANFKFIDVSENFLSGSIPPDMCKNGQMSDLLLLQNEFTGQVPASYANCKTLIRLRINNNSLSGMIPSGLWGLPNVLIIDLSMNQFEGPVTADIGNAESLALLILAHNKFSGNLPVAISQASSLVSVQLSSNDFSGEIPKTIGDLKRLISLYLDGNKFSGTIPESIGSCVSISDINLSGNNLSGKIPDSLGSLQSLNSLNLSSNELSGEIPVTLSSLKLSNLDLSNNQLCGSIPASIEAFRGGLKGNPGLCSRNLKEFQPCPSKSRRSSHRRVFLSCFAAGMFVLVVIGACLMILKFGKAVFDHSLKHHRSWSMKSYTVTCFCEKDIIDAIKSENLIGKGGSGHVYKVVLGNGHTLAVKHIWTANSYDQRCNRSSTAILSRRCSRSAEFDAEVATLSAIRHVNVVKLYCSITSEDSHLLVYEYLPNGSLWDRLHLGHKVEIGWECRYAIAVGAARGLEYLHHGLDKPVIHRDVKSSNILLDEEWKPRIADFGLAKIMQAGSGGDWTHVIAGTLGYIAPEYAYTCKITEKSDVYSFGVVLMELIAGKRPIEPEFGDNEDIVHWVRSKISNKDNIRELVDSSISEEHKEDAFKVLKVAVLCTSKIPVSRPSMRTVVHMLEEAEPCRLSCITVVDNKELDCGSISNYNDSSSSIASP